VFYIRKPYFLQILFHLANYIVRTPKASPYISFPSSSVPDYESDSPYNNIFKMIPSFPSGKRSWKLPNIASYKGKI